MKIIVFLGVFFTLLNLNATDNQLEIKVTLVREFSLEELRTAQLDSDIGEPHAIYFDYEGKLSICDTMNNRIVKYNDQYEIIESIPIDKYTFYNPMSFNYEDEENFYQFTRYTMKILDKETLDLRKVSLVNMRKDFTYNHAIFINNTYINWTKDNEIYSIEDPQGDDYKKNNSKLQGNDKTLELLRSEKFSSKGYTVDDKKRIFLNGELVTRSFSMFWDYWNDNREKMIIFGKEADLYAYSGSILLGRDLDGNYIWDAGGIILIFNDHGKFMHYIYEPDFANAILTQIDGDIYYLMNRKYPMKLFKIEKQW